MLNLLKSKKYLNLLRQIVKLNNNKICESIHIFKFVIYIINEVCCDWGSRLVALIICLPKLNKVSYKELRVQFHLVHPLISHQIIYLERKKYWDKSSQTLPTSPRIHI